MALGSDKLREWHVMQSCPERHERSAGQGLGLLAPKEETQEKRSFSPIGTTVSDCGAWTSCSYPASSLQMGQRWRETGRWRILWSCGINQLWNLPDVQSFSEAKTVCPLSYSSVELDVLLFGTESILRDSNNFWIETFQNNSCFFNFLKNIKNKQIVIGPGKSIILLPQAMQGCTAVMPWLPQCCIRT